VNTDAVRSGQEGITQTAQINSHIRLTRDIATCMHYTGFDPLGTQVVYVTRHFHGRKMQPGITQKPFWRGA